MRKLHPHSTSHVQIVFVMRLHVSVRFWSHLYLFSPEDDILGLHAEVSGVSLLFLILADVLTDDHSSRRCL
jgi:hypothetical protein